MRLEDRSMIYNHQRSQLFANPDQNYIGRKCETCYIDLGLVTSTVRGLQDLTPSG